MNIQSALQIEKEKHPLCAKQDELKLIVQSFLGNGHLISSEEESLFFLKEEKKKAVEPQEMQEIGNGWIRVPLFCMEEKDLCLWNRLFVYGTKYKADIQGYQEALKECGLSDAGIVSHSDEYKKAYDPHYRILRKELAEAFPLCKAVWNAFETNRVVCIDGPCASGKTTVSGWLAEVFDCSLIHMDDYFLRPSQRTKERLASPGGNVDHERFRKEVIEPILQDRPICIRPYDCSTRSFKENVMIDGSKPILIEGSYSHHPAFADLPAYRIFLTIDPDEQIKRLKIRDPKKLDDFIRKWIPMEEAYFKAFEIRKKSDFVFSR